MRDPERIERIGVKLIAVWELHPDWRLGQVISNLCGGMSGGRKDVFFPEDYDWEKWIDDELIWNTKVVKKPWKEEKRAKATKRSREWQAKR
jgi:hypothetical protein